MSAVLDSNAAMIDEKAIWSSCMDQPGWARDLEVWCESPIEIEMYGALIRTWPPCYKDGRRWDRGPGVLMLQAPLGEFRADFALAAFREYGPCFDGLGVVIECDGHDWHERTKEQAIRDRRKDRLIQLRGDVIFRFTGREIHRNSERCALEVWNLVLDRLPWDDRERPAE